MLYRYKDFKEMTDQELVDASFNLEKILMKGVAARQNPKYKAKFKNQPPPNINPALMKLRDDIANEFKERQKEKQNEPES